MADQRAEGKKLIGAQASAELWAGVDRWLELNPGKTVTDFVLAACLEKLKMEEIPVDEIAALRDRRGRLPEPRSPGGPVKYSIPNSRPASSSAKLLDVAAEKPGDAPKRRRKP